MKLVLALAILSTLGQVFGVCPPQGGMAQHGDYYFLRTSGTYSISAGIPQCQGMGLEIATMNTLAEYTAVIAFGATFGTASTINVGNPDLSNCQGCSNQIKDTVTNAPVDTTGYGGLITASPAESCLEVTPSNGFIAANFGCVARNVICKSECLLNPTATDGNWGNWLGWSSCSAACGGGTRSRLRLCDNPPPSTNPQGLWCGASALHNETENGSCNTNACAPTTTTTAAPTTTDPYTYATAAYPFTTVPETTEWSEEIPASTDNTAACLAKCKEWCDQSVEEEVCMMRSAKESVPGTATCQCWSSLVHRHPGVFCGPRQRAC